MTSEAADVPGSAPFLPARRIGIRAEPRRQRPIRLCTGAGIFRSLRIVTSEPIPLESITGSGETEHGGRVTFTDAH